MSVSKYFKNTPRSPSQRATGPKCNFFSLNLQRGPWKKRGLSPLPQPATGGLSPVAPPRATNGPSPRARQGGLSPPPRATGGPVAPPLGRPGYAPLYKLQPSPSLLIWARKFHQKSRKKERSEEKESGEALPDSALVICRLLHLVYILLYLSNTPFK